MIFDIILRIGKNAVGKDAYNVVRVPDRVLSDFLRKAQDNKYYIISVIPLFRLKMKDVVVKHILLQDESAFNKEDQEVREQSIFDNAVGAGDD